GDIEAAKTPGMTGLVEAVARGYHKLLAIKDEYEVARLFTDGTFEREISNQFDGYRGLHFHLAPPFIASLYKDNATGHPRKIALPGWLMLPVFRTLVKAKWLRGTRLDVFGWTEERRLERQMIADYEAVLDQIAMQLTPASHAMAVELALQGLDIKGFGHVKRSAYESVKAKRGQLLVSMRGLSCPEVITQNSMTDAQRLRSEPCRDVA